MPSDTIQWFPGHMAKTRRMIGECLSDVDFVIELLDARIPRSSRNPEISSLTSQKPTLLLLNKASLADEKQNALWLQHYTDGDTLCLLTDCQSGQGMGAIPAAVKRLMAEKLARYEARGMAGRKLKAMVLGIPNVGKSSFINKVAGAKRAKVENRPGVTLDKQWISTGIGVDLLDMPGILWPRFDDRLTAENLAATGAIKDDITDIEGVATALCGRLRTLYPDLLSARYKLGDMAQYAETNDRDLMETVGKKRGFLQSGGVIDTERTANMLLDEFRAAKIGRITLDR